MSEQKSPSSPAVGRIVSILNFFATNPGETFAFTEVAGALRLSRATCHGLLVGLAEAGYLHRRADKRYELGPAIMALSAKIPQQGAPDAIIRQELRILADDLDVIAAALFPDDADIVVRERAASVTHLGASLPAGQRYPMNPWGGFVLTTLAGAELDAEIDRLAPGLASEAREVIHEQGRFARRHGFVLGLYPEGVSRGVTWRPHGEFARDLDPDADLPLMFIIATVLDARGKVAFGIAIYAFSRLYNGREITALGERVRSVAQRLSAFVAGKPGPAP
jgi:DNA-binding IclR family transcriptional regulator